MHDVAVIGAGPAGSTAARMLAARGHDVVVLEEHPVTGVPVHCTGLIGDDAFDEFELPQDTILGVASAARFRAGDGGSVLVESDRVRATVIDRVRFDQELARQAEGAGAEIRTGWRVDDVRVGPDGVRVSSAGRALDARACVLACGANYRFHRALDLGLPRAYLQSLQLETPFPPVSHVQVRLGREVAPKGFAWLVSFARDGASHARIGLMCEGDGRQRFERFVADLCREHGVDARSLAAPRPKMLPLGPVRRTYASRVVTVGDAAGLVKPTTGGGIYYGLITGSIAAAVLDAGLRADALDAADLKPYETRWRARLGPDIRIGLAFRRLAERFDDRAINAVVELARIDGVVPLLRQTASFNWHRRAALALMNHGGFRKILLRALLRSAAPAALQPLPPAGGSTPSV
jgi:digeranylgeranylglycerophospholipid reductase